MGLQQDALATLVAKDEIRELALLYSRAADRRDIALMRSLYTDDATDNHGDLFSGTADEFAAFIEANMSGMSYTGHHICNHLISIDGDDEAHGEAYALAYHVVLGEDGAVGELVMAVRYLDHYRRVDERWRFAKRHVMFDYQTYRPIEWAGQAPIPGRDPSYTMLTGALFAAGPRGGADRFSAAAGSR